MHASQRAADRVMVESSTNEGLLRVAVAAAGAQRMVMDIISLVAGDAQVAGATQPPLPRMAGCAS